MRLIFMTILTVLFLLELYEAGKIPYELDLYYHPRSKRDVQANSIETQLLKNEIDTSIVLRNELQWENLLLPAPTAIALLGQLIILSTKHDFNFTELNPSDTYKYMKHPGSFRATLSQVAHDAWQAFLQAHTNMDAIHLYMANLPSHINTTIKIITKYGSNPLFFKKLLSRSLSSILNQSQASVQLVSEADKAILNVKDLLDEIIEKTVACKSPTVTKYKRTKEQKDAAEQKRAFLEQYDQMMRQKLDQIDREVQMYQDAYRKAVEEIPTGWKAFAINILRSIPPWVMFVVAPIPTTIAYIANPDIFAPTGSSQRTNEPLNVTFSSVNEVKVAHIIAIMQQVSEMIDQVKKAVNENFYDNSTKSDSANQFIAFKVILRTFHELLQGLDEHEITRKGEAIIQNATNMCEHLSESYNTSNNITVQNKTQLLGELDVLSNAVKPLLAISAYPSLNVSIQDSNVHKILDNNEKFKASSILKQFQNAHNRSDKAYLEIMQNQDRMTQLMVNMTKLNFETVNLEQILDLLDKGVSIMANISEHWSTLTRFFSNVSVHTEVTLVGMVNMFMIDSDAWSLDSLTQDERAYLAKTLSDGAHNVYGISNFLATVAETYTNISGNFLNRLAGFDRLQLIRRNAERRQKINELHAQCRQSQQEILTLAQQKRRDFNVTVQRRIQEVNSVLAIWAGPTEEELEAKAAKDRAAIEGRNGTESVGTGVDDNDDIY